MKNKKTLKKLAIGALVAGACLGVGAGNVFAEEAAEPCETLTVNEVCATDYYEMQSLLKSNRTAGIKKNVVTLYSDINDPLTNTWQLTATLDITINLNGHNITTGQSWIVYANKVTLTGNGKISFSSLYPINVMGSKNVSNREYTVLNVGPGVEIEGRGNGQWSVVTMAYTSMLEYKYGVVVNFDGKATQKNGSGSIFYINGQYGDTNFIFNYGPTAYANLDAGMYVAGGANVNYAGRMDVRSAGIEIRGGSLNITGGSIKVDPNQPYILRDNPKSGMATFGTAITVTQHTTKLPIDVSISGGDFTASKPFVEFDAVGNGQESYSAVTGQISGGNFVSTSNEDAVSSADWTEFITGGDYTPARLEQDYIHPLYEDEEIHTEYWRIYPREIDLNGKTIKDGSGEDVISTVELGVPALADRKYPVEFSMIDDAKISEAQEKNPDYPNLIAGTSIKILRDNGDDVIIGEDNAITLFLGVNDEQLRALKEYDRLYAHLLDDDGNVSEKYPAKLVSRRYNDKTYYLVGFNIMGLGTANYLISGEKDPRTIMGEASSSGSSGGSFSGSDGDDLFVTDDDDPSHSGESFGDSTTKDGQPKYELVYVWVPGYFKENSYTSAGESSSDATDISRDWMLGEWVPGKWVIKKRMIKREEITVPDTGNNLALKEKILAPDTGMATHSDRRVRPSASSENVSLVIVITILSVLFGWKCFRERN